LVALPAEPFSDVNRWEPSAALMSSDSAEWYTPRHIIEAVISALGAIDVDPCADPDRSVPATTHYTPVENGLVQEWHGRVYMNPPYGRPIVDWAAKLAEEYAAGRTTAAVALVPARTETDWWASIDGEFVCFVHGRLSFSSHTTSAPFPSAAIYLGSDGRDFVTAFRDLGEVYQRVRE
jgi:phage N-6-adenine-methyltransferase